MKKTRIFSMVFAIGLIGLVATGCGGSPNEPQINKDTDKATITKQIKFNVADAKYLATRWTKEANGRSARDADDETTTLDSLVAIVEDAEGELTTETAMEVPAEELKLADWCVPQAVREIYQCPYETAEDAAKGVYTVFAGWIDWWQYTDGTKAPSMSELMYAKPDGTTVVDVLNINGKVDYALATWQKENDGEDYLQFDTKGNIFILAIDCSTDEYVIFRYHPDTDKVDSYKLSDIDGKAEIMNFKVTKDGEWVFMNVMVDGKKNNVYAVQINTKKPPVTLYEYKVDEEPDEPTWAVSSIGVNPFTNIVYWYVDDYNDAGKPASGLYVVEKKSAGYLKENVKRYHTIEWWQILDYVKKYVTKSNNYSAVLSATASAAADYEGLLNLLKSVCNYNGEIEFNPSIFKDMTAIDVVDWDGQEKEMDFSKIYKEDAEGKPLTDVAALKYLFETSYEDAYEVADEYKSDWTKQNLFSNCLELFFHTYWCKKDNQGVEVGIGAYKDEGYSDLIGQTDQAFPLGYVMLAKGKKDDKGNPISAYITKDTEAFIKSALGAKTNGIILANDEGTWVLSDIWDMDAENNDHAVAFQLTDDKGNFVCNQPGDLDKLKFRPKYDKTALREEGDPWYQKPFAANSNGIAILANDQKTIYYHSGDKTIDLLANDENKSSIGVIYSFSLQENQLIYNATKKNGSKKHLMVSIDFTDNYKSTVLPIEDQVESMLGL